MFDELEFWWKMNNPEFLSLLDFSLNLLNVDYFN